MNIKYSFFLLILSISISESTSMAEKEYNADDNIIRIMKESHAADKIGSSKANKNETYEKIDDNRELKGDFNKEEQEDIATVEKYYKMLKKDPSKNKNYASLIGGLGFKYYSEFNRKVNLVLAFDFFSKAAQYGDRQSQYYLGIFYRKGKVVEKNLDKAIYWLKKARDQGDKSCDIFIDGALVERNKTTKRPTACEEKYILALSYFNGDGIDKDNKRAKENIIYGMACQNQDVINLYESNKNELSFNKDDSFKLLSVGRMLLNNKNISDKDGALKLISEAATLGNADAQYDLGIFYLEGTFGEKDRSKALYWFKKASDQNNHKAEVIYEMLNH